MSNPKAAKAKELYERIQATSRVVELATIKMQIDNDPEFNALDKMNMGHFVTTRMRELNENALNNMKKEVLGEVMTAPEAEVDPIDELEVKGDYVQQEAHRLYTLFFAAASGHPSLVKRNFEKYMDRVIAVFKLPEKYTVLLQEWDKYQYQGRRLSLEDPFYWLSDHMTILPGAIKRVQDQTEASIHRFYKEDDVDWGFLDLVRRTLHAIELMADNYEEIRAYVDEAKKKGTE